MKEIFNFIRFLYLKQEQEVGFSGVLRLIPTFAVPGK